MLSWLVGHDLLLPMVNLLLVRKLVLIECDPKARIHKRWDATA